MVGRGWDGRAEQEGLPTRGLALGPPHPYFLRASGPRRYRVQITSEDGFAQSRVLETQLAIGGNGPARSTSWAVTPASCQPPPAVIPNAPGTGSHLGDQEYFMFFFKLALSLSL